MASSAGAGATTGVAVPASNPSEAPLATVCRPGCHVRSWSRTSTPSTRPVARTVTGSVTCRVTSVWIQTVVCSVSVGGAGRLNVLWSPKKYTSAMRVGITSAENLSQNWNACTNVTERMPPTSTVPTTTTAAATEPSV